MIFPSSRTSPIRVVVVEDDVSQRDMLVHWLESENYVVQAFANGTAMTRNLDVLQSADLLILDWDLPDLPGDALLRWVRSQRLKLPVIFHTVHDREQDVVEILKSGSDDYLIKPSQRPILMARVQAVLRRTAASMAEPLMLNVGGVVLHRTMQSIKVGNVTEKMNDKEFAIAWEFGLHVGQVVLRQQLLSVVWGLNQNVETRTVDMYISRLRGILKQLGATEWKIRSVYGIGYRLIVESE